MTIGNNPAKSLDLVCLGEPMVEFNQNSRGAFLAEYCRAEDLLSSAFYANTAAAISTQNSDAISSIPRRDQVLASLSL